MAGGKCGVKLDPRCFTSTIIYDGFFTESLGETNIGFGGNIIRATKHKGDGGRSHSPRAKHRKKKELTTFGIGKNVIPGSLIFFDSLELSAVDPWIIIDHMFAGGCIWMFVLQKEDGVCIKSVLVTCQIKYFESNMFPK